MKLNGKQLEVVIDDLSGKYYGTEISILNPDGETEWSFTLWNTSGYNPSERELEGYPFTYQEYIENKPFEVKEDGGIYCDWHKGDMVKPQDYYEICDSHWESQATYLFATALKELIESCDLDIQDKEE